MRISITEKEYNAINFGLDQIRDALEAASDEEYITSAKEAMDYLYNVIDKYRTARVKANELNDARSYVRSRNGWMPQAKVDKIARKLIKKIHNENNSDIQRR